MEGQFKEIIRQKIADSLAMSVPEMTRRDIELPKVPRKALAVIGMRRGGKTYFLWQCLADKLASGSPRETLLYFNFEDERLSGMSADHLQSVVEEYYLLHPEFRDKERVTFFLDEIQVVPGWERFARRLLDSEKMDLFISGSSARLLSREVATSMRGRALETIVYPFSFREALRHAGAEPSRSISSLPKATRSDLEKRFIGYLTAGGFPEAQGLGEADRVPLLRSYVDVVILRDVIERHNVSNVVALRWLQRNLLANAAGSFSINKYHRDLKSQGIPIGKDTLHEYLGHLEDAFLINTVSVHSASKRKRMVNPRKSYPIDPGLIPIYERTGRANLGHALETAVFIELKRRGCEVSYVRATGEQEVDFIAQDFSGRTALIQICADVGIQETYEREVRALADASALFPKATPVLLTLEAVPTRARIQKPIQPIRAIEWLLDDSITFGLKRS